MFRNVESHFATVPVSEKPRSMFKRPKPVKTSFNAGDLVPLYCEPVYPGDTVQMTTNSVVRFQTLLAPVLDNAWMDVAWFFVPLRIIFNRTKEFFGENTASPWIPSVTYQIPAVSAPSGGFAVGGLADHLEYPVGVNWSASDKNAPSVLPFRAYAEICDKFWRDQNLSDPLNIPHGDSNQTGTNGTNYINDVANGGALFKVAKFHDVFTSCLPSPEKGPAVTFPLISGTMAPVGTRANTTAAKISSTFANNSLRWRKVTGGTGSYDFADNTFYDFIQQGHVESGRPNWASTYSFANGNSVLPSGNFTVTPDNLWADLSDTVGAVTVNQLRLSFQLQKYYESLARSGSRYHELIAGLFGISNPDSRVQIPEYLGGKRIPINVSEVTNYAQTATDFLGDLGAVSRTSDSHTDFVKSFSEYGILMCVACVRTDRSYSQGCPHWLLRKKAEEWYNPIFASIGEQPVPKATIYANGYMNSDAVFGYQEAWYDLRYSVPACTGLMRPGVSNSLATWHYGDYYAAAPTLSDGWIREDKTVVDRTLAVTSSVSDQLFGDFLFDAIWTRVLPMYSVPGLIDHF